jgi:lipoate-protein ligase A
MNLREINPDISVPALNAGLTAAFQAVYGLTAGPLTLNSRDEEEIQREAEHLASPAWLFPPRIPFALEISGRFPWGGVRIGLCVRQNRVQAAECQSDALNERVIREIQDALPGSPFEGEALERRVLAAAAQCEEPAGGVFPHARIARDIADLIRTRLTAEKSRPLIRL